METTDPRPKKKSLGLTWSNDHLDYPKKTYFIIKEDSEVNEINLINAIMKAAERKCGCSFAYIRKTEDKIGIVLRSHAGGYVEVRVR